MKKTNWEVSYICSFCKALLIVESEDINANFDINLNLCYTFICTCCNINNEIKKRFLPLGVKVLSLKKYKCYLKGYSVYERFIV